MRTTRRTIPRLNFLHPAWVLLFALISVVWIVLASVPDWTSPTLRTGARLAGYVGFIAMLIPYIHVIRRRFRAIRGEAMTTWLRWHIGAAYLAFAMVLIHSRGRSNGPVTAAILWLVWMVMVSGIVGFYGQKLLYFLMPRIIPHEYGLERLPGERKRLADQAGELIDKLAASEGVIKEFCAAAKTERFDPPLSVFPRNWFRGEAQARTILSDNGLQRAGSFATPEQKAELATLWEMVEARRLMDVEYRLHQLGRLWLFVHGPAAWALLVLMTEHVVMSWWYGGM